MCKATVIFEEKLGKRREGWAVYLIRAGTLLGTLTNKSKPRLRRVSGSTA